MGKKVTDLEKFALTEIYLPYQNELNCAYERLSTPIDRDLSHAKYHLVNAPEWAELVLGRLEKIKFYFPSYVKHELVSYLRQKGVVASPQIDEDKAE